MSILISKRYSSDVSNIILPEDGPEVSKHVAVTQ
jgi:hypothetical protein